jgi:hypothetical protein
VAGSAQITSRNLTACHDPIKLTARAFVPNYFPAPEQDGRRLRGNRGFSIGRCIQQPIS